MAAPDVSYELKKKKVTINYWISYFLVKQFQMFEYIKSFVYLKTSFCHFLGSNALGRSATRPPSPSWLSC